MLGSGLQQVGRKEMGRLIDDVSRMKMGAFFLTYPSEAATVMLGASVETRIPIPTEASAVMPSVARKRAKPGREWVKSMIQ